MNARIKMNRQKRLVSLYLSALACFFWLTESSSEPHNQAFIALHTKLQGKWLLYSSATDGENADFVPTSSQYRTVKLYSGDNFFYFRYGNNGQLYRSFGGTFVVTGPDTIAETIEFYAPFEERYIAYGQQGQMVVTSGQSMISATSNLTLNLDNDVMLQQGVRWQNVPKGEDKKMFGPIYLANKYLKLARLPGQNHDSHN